jgi:inner membrane protein
MEHKIAEQGSNKFIQWLKKSIAIRMLMIGFLTLILIIPLLFIEDLIRERAQRQQSVVNEINQQWGDEVLLYGPILKIPYKIFREKKLRDIDTNNEYKEVVEEIAEAYFFPDNLLIEASVNPEEKKRGIYRTAVYSGNIGIKGNFIAPNFNELEIDSNNVLWDKATMILQTSNLKGIKEKVEIQLGKTKHTLISQYKTVNKSNFELVLHQLESKYLNFREIKDQSNIPFTINMAVNGSESVQFIPVGKETTANIKSDWKDASFFGEYLPYNADKISKDGFDAKWKVLDINRPFPQHYLNNIPDLKEYAFGVDFMIPVDEYQKSERSAKYGFLVIGLTFLIFFLIQTLSKINIHPFQYLMIGLALTMFYTLLISISEHSNFLKAYLIAGISVIALISLYSKTILKNIKFPIFIGLSLTALYTFIFVIIQLENYALLVGSIGLFVILATVMFVSKKIDWNNG